MDTSRLLTAAAMMLLLAAPAVGFAQTATPAPQNGTVTGTGTSTPNETGESHHGQFGMRKLLKGIALSDAQQQQITQLVTQFRQAHQPGSPRDPQAMQNLRTSIENVLTSDQRTQLESNIAEMRQNRQAHRNNANGTGSGANNNNPSNGPFAPDTSASPNPAAI